jgi:hypothetical protein
LRKDGDIIAFINRQLPHHGKLSFKLEADKKLYLLKAQKMVVKHLSAGASSFKFNIERHL